MCKKALSFAIPIVLVFSAVLWVQFAFGLTTSIDSRWCIHTAVSILKEGNADLDEFSGVMEPQDYRLEEVRGHVYSKYPIGSPLIAVPFVFVIDRVASRTMGLDLYAYLQQVPPGHRANRIGRFVACVLVASTSALIFVLARQFLDVGLAILVTLVFAFCTSTWSIASRELWTHTPSMLLLTATLCLAVFALRVPRLIQFAGVLLGFSYVVRPTNALSVILWALYVFVRYRRQFVGFVLWGLVVGIPFMLFNLSVYGALLSPYYRPTSGAPTPYAMMIRIGESSSLLRSLAGTLISPSRGLLVFTPILLFSVWGVLLKMRRGQFGALERTLLAAIVMHVLLISSFPMWWGGWVYGPRMLTDLLPYATYFLIAAVAYMRETVGILRLVVVSIFVCCTAFSFFVHFRGATSWDAVYWWNRTPANVDLHPDRLWDWRDPQFLRGFRLGL